MSSSPSRLSCPRKRASSNRRGGNRMFVESACAAYFPVDSRNENLPEKCIHQNYASRPGRHAARDFCCAGAVPFPEDTKRCVKAAAPRGQTRCNRWLQETVVGWVPIVVGLLFTMNAATST